MSDIQHQVLHSTADSYNMDISFSESAFVLQIYFRLAKLFAAVVTVRELQGTKALLISRSSFFPACTLVLIRKKS